MSVGSFIFNNLEAIASTYPVPAPIGTDIPYITYNIDGQDKVPVLSGSDVTKNFVTITAYESDYDSAMALYESIKGTLKGAVDTANGIMGVTYSGMSNGYDPEPADQHSVSLEFTIYER